MTFPTPVPEIPAAKVDKAAVNYVNSLGFTSICQHAMAPVSVHK